MFEDINLKTAQEIKVDTNNAIIQNKKDELMKIINEIKESSNSGSYAIKHDKVVEYLLSKGYGYKVEKHAYREYTKYP